MKGLQTISHEGQMMKLELTDYKGTLIGERTIAQLKGCVYKELCHTLKKRYWVNSGSAKKDWWKTNEEKFKGDKLGLVLKKKNLYF